MSESAALPLPASDAAIASLAPPGPRRPRIVPDAYVLLANWRYVEHALLRVIAGWGRSAADWEDKIAVCHHTWFQAEAVERIRRRLEMFVGGKPDQPVNEAFGRLMNGVLLAPSFADAMAGVHELIQPALASAYAGYIRSSHPVHDMPTHTLVREIIAFKQTQAEWYRGFRERHPQKLDAAYLERIRETLAEVGELRTPIGHVTPFAAACGRGTPFVMPYTPGRPKGWDDSPDVFPFLELDYSASVEARRVWFMIGFMREMGVAEDQLSWIYYADHLPWQYTYEEARHMWDESRHGDSGLARLRDFGLGIEHVGYSSYGKYGDHALAALTPRDLYEQFYGVTQIAEAGFFQTKRDAFADFDRGGDDSSAEMMQFDIIDETSHVAYGHHWLPSLMQAAGIEEDYRARGLRDRAATEQAANNRVAALRDFVRTGSLPVPDAPLRGVEPNAANKSIDRHTRILSSPKARAHYEWLLTVVREKLPLKGADKMPVRPNLPM